MGVFAATRVGFGCVRLFARFGCGRENARGGSAHVVHMHQHADFFAMLLLRFRRARKRASFFLRGACVGPLHHYVVPLPRRRGRMMVFVGVRVFLDFFGDFGDIRR
jgi:hypothetical protein